MREEIDTRGIQRNWPQYHIEKVLGQGGYGKVYQITREYLGNTISSAVKVIHIPSDEKMETNLLSEGMKREEIKEYYRKMAHNFLRENSAMEKLKSASNIVSIEDCIIEELQNGYVIYIKMELLESLENLLRNYNLNSTDVAMIGKDISEALIVCEKKHIVHRDIKPANIFINEFGTFKLGDFGVAKHLEPGQTNMTQIGTGMYMAPELYRGNIADERVDIYSLGITLYRLANQGRFPLVEPGMTDPISRQEALVRRLQGEKLPLPCEVDEKLGKIILKACAYKPEHRYKNARELKHDLDFWLFNQEFSDSTSDIFNVAQEAANSSAKATSNSSTDLSPTEDLTEKVELGRSVWFGTYPQSENGEKDYIEWIVLAKKRNQLFLLSRYTLDARPYHNTFENTQWNRCDLRNWLNNDFLKTSFEEGDQKEIISHKASYTSPNGDKIFLLSDDEIKKYLPSKESRASKPTRYAKKKGVRVNKQGKCIWWLRSPGSNKKYTQIVDHRYYVNRFGGLVTSDYIGVRPALWVNMTL